MATASSISAVDLDVIETHILTRLDPASLATASCVSSELQSLIASNETLWTGICNSTWPSTNTPRLRHVISSFPQGHRSFFSDSLTNPDIATTSSSDLNLPSEFISAVDVHYQKRHLFSQVIETETFNSSPFRIKLLNRKDSALTRLPQPINENMYRELAEGLTLSWILIDPIERRAMNLSSYKPVTVERNLLSDEEVIVRYAWVFSAGEEGTSLEYAKCGIAVTCEGFQSGEMHVTKVVFQLEDTYGKKLSGEDSLVILKKGMVGKRGKLNGREEEGKKRYEEYMKMRWEILVRRERTQLTQRRLLDTSFEAFSNFIFVSLGLFVFSILYFVFF